MNSPPPPEVKVDRAGNLVGWQEFVAWAYLNDALWNRAMIRGQLTGMSDASIIRLIAYIATTENARMLKERVDYLRENGQPNWIAP